VVSFTIPGVPPSVFFLTDAIVLLETWKYFLSSEFGSVLRANKSVADMQKGQEIPTTTTTKQKTKKHINMMSDLIAESMMNFSLVLRLIFA